MEQGLTGKLGDSLVGSYGARPSNVDNSDKGYNYIPTQQNFVPSLPKNSFSSPNLPLNSPQSFQTMTTSIQLPTSIPTSPNNQLNQVSSFARPIFVTTTPTTLPINTTNPYITSPTNYCISQNYNITPNSPKYINKHNQINNGVLNSGFINHNNGINFNKPLSGNYNNFNSNDCNNNINNKGVFK
jgi:hypothetical protein